MSDKPELADDDTPSVPLYAEGDIVRHKASKQAAIILYAKYVVIHDRSCPCLLPPCDCPAIFTGEYTVSTGFTKDEEVVVDECVLEAR